MSGVDSGSYTSSTAGSPVSSEPPVFYYRHPLHHAGYSTPVAADIPYGYLHAQQGWSESPGSGRSVSPCDEYQPPLSEFGALHELGSHQCTSTVHPPAQPYVRVTKRRNTANKKERRRTQSINNAFADLRDCIPNVPADTKLSKIKTLRLATSYIAYLMNVLAAEEEDGGFRAELTAKRVSHHHAQQPRLQQQQQQLQQHQLQQLQHGVQEEQAVIEHARRCSEMAAAVAAERKGKGRTGWPQHVWALELKP